MAVEIESHKPTDREIWEWIKSHNAYDWSYDDIAKAMVIEAIENAHINETAYPGLKDTLIAKVKGVKIE